MRRQVLLAAAVMLLAVAGASASIATHTKVSATSTKVALDLPPRFMWGWGDGLRGYCGETSFQSWGLLFGNYISSEPVRDAADGRELLIAVNDAKAANNLRFSYEEWDYENAKEPQAKAFLTWVANHIDAGHGVVAGFFEQKDNMDPDYDHIMPIFGYLRDDSDTTSNSTIKKGSATRTDILGIYYNDLYRKDSLFGDTAKNFIQSRNGCGSPNGITPLAPPYSWCLPKDYDYGIAIKGNRDDNKETFPARLTVSDWTEPDYGAEDQLHQKTVTFSATLNIRGLTAGTKYTVLRFDHKDDVPVSNFGRGAYEARFDFTASATTHTLAAFDQFESDSTMYYRVVKTSSVV